MQEEYVHLTKRHSVLALFQREINDYNKEWKKKTDALPECDCKVLAKFIDGTIEEVYFCNQLPHWWYVKPGNRPPVITKDIVEWK